ncbi:hypothetical protein [Streptomyces zhihengii]
MDSPPAVQPEAAYGGIAVPISHQHLRDRRPVVVPRMRRQPFLLLTYAANPTRRACGPLHTRFSQWPDDLEPGAASASGHTLVLDERVESTV